MKELKIVLIFKYNKLDIEKEIIDKQENYETKIINNQSSNNLNEEINKLFKEDLKEYFEIKKENENENIDFKIFGKLNYIKNKLIDLKKNSKFKKKKIKNLKENNKKLLNTISIYEKEIELLKKK
jgi:hypothetical protein